MLSEKDKSSCCCFTGHRPEKLISKEKDIKKIESEIKKLLRPIISQSILDGYTTYITGMARGFDMWAADIIIEEKIKNPKIRLICALPINDFEKRWSADEQKHYHNILNIFDYITVVSKKYSRSCFQLRNIFMVDHSSKVIAAYNGEAGGTKNTICYAKKHNIEVINILKKEE